MEFISEEEWEAQFTAQEKQKQIILLKQNLQATDYQAIKFAEGELSAEDYAEIKEQRRQWRVQINELEKGLKNV